MKVENLRTLIRESIQEYVKEIDEAAENAAMEARISKCDEAIAAREAKLNNIEESEHADLMDESKIKNLQNEIKELKKAKAKFEKAAEKKAAKKAKKSAPKEEEEDVVTDAVTEDAPIDETDVLSNMNTEETAINESFLKMQKLAGVITEAQYNQKKSLIEAKANDSVKALLKIKLKNDAKLKELMKKWDDAETEDNYLGNTGQMNSLYGNDKELKKASKDIIDHVKKVMGMDNLEIDLEDVKNAIE